MKKIVFFLMCVASFSFAFTSCSSLGSSVSSLTSSNTAASTLGASTGTALVSLYNSYKSTGKLDLTNTTNLSNALTVCTAYTQLKANQENSSYKNAFCTGLVTGGSGIITTANASNLLASLLNAAGLSGVNSSNINTTVQTANTLITLFNAFKS